MQPGFDHEVRVRFRDCDEMGHVNNAVYFTYLEETRFAFFEQLRQADDLASLDSGATVPRSPGIILARVACDYRSPAVHGEVLRVRLSVASVGRSSFGYDYEIVDRARHRLVAQATSVQVTYDYEQARSVPIPEALRRALERSRVG